MGDVFQPLEMLGPEGVQAEINIYIDELYGFITELRLF